MSRISPLPERIRYLEPVRKQLNKLGPEGVHEDTDLSILRKAVRERVNGLSEEVAKKILAGDGEELNQWLAAPERQNDLMFFVLAFLGLDATDVLLKEEQPPPPPVWFVQMELPDGAKVKDESYGMLLFRFQKITACVYPNSQDGMLRDIAQFQISTERPGMADEVTVSKVQFGEVDGVKCVMISTSLRQCKSIAYALNVPGGHVGITLHSNAKDFDESKLESCFKTIRLVQNHSAI